MGARHLFLGARCDSVHQLRLVSGPGGFARVAAAIQAPNAAGADMTQAETLEIFARYFVKKSFRFECSMDDTIGQTGGDSDSNGDK